MRKKLAALVAVAAVILTGCGNVSPEADQAPIVYNDNYILPAEKTFVECLPPASQKFVWANRSYTYPFGQRTWTFGGEGADTASIEVVTKDQQKMRVTGVATFALNTSCEAIGDRWPGGAFQQFHERIGRKYLAWTPQGWVDFLNVYMTEPLEKALDTVSQNYSYAELYGGADDVEATKNKWEDEVGALVVREVRSQSGMDLFCEPAYDGTGECGDLSITLQKPDISEELAASLEKREIARAENAAQEERNATQLTELEGVQDRIDVLGGVENYLLEKAIEDGAIELIPVPEDSGLLISPR